MSQDTSQYSLIDETQERLILSDLTIISGIGVMISLMILYSSIHTSINLKHSKDIPYYVNAVRCGILACIGSLIMFSLQLFANDLIFPIDSLFTSNTTFVSIVDSIEMITVVLFKITAYFGYTFMYLAIFRRAKMDTILKVLLCFVSVAQVAFAVAYLVDDLLVFSMKEIGFTAKRHVYVPYQTPSSRSVTILALGVIVTDFIFVSTLLSRYIIAGRRCVDDYRKKANAVRGIVLLCCSIMVWIAVCGVNVLDLNIKSLVDSFPVFADVICLYLMYRNNAQLYDRLCGCVCGKCCSQICFGGYYKMVPESQEEGDDNDRLPLNNSDPSFML